MTDRLEPGDIVLPLDAHQPSAADDLLIQRAQHALVAGCLRRSGLSYRLPAPYHSDVRATRARAFGLIDENEARHYGYGGAAGPDSRPPSARPPAAVAGRLPGCEQEADRRLLAGREPVSLTVLDDLTVRTGQQAEADRRVRAKFAAWSRCMHRHGYTYSGPWRANDRAWPPGPTAAERRTAVTDVRCKHGTGLLLTWYAVLLEYQHAAERAYAPLLRRIDRQTAVRAANARRVLRSG